MTDPIAADDPVLSTEFGAEIVRQMRAQDTYGTNEKLNDAQLLAPFILSKEQKRDLPLIGTLDAKTLMRIEVFYNAIAMMIEKECRLMAVPLVHINAEGLGRIVMTVGKLVVVDRSVREAHRFGFASLSKMKDEADAILSVALELIGNYSKVAGL